MALRITFRLSALGFGGAERVFLSVADYLSTAHNCKIDFVIDRICNHETERIAVEKGYQLVGLNASRSWKTILPFSRYLKAQRPDVVITAYTETNAAALISKFLIGAETTVIVTEHASIDQHWQNKSRLRKLILEFIVRYVYKLADHVLCVSKGMAEQLKGRLTNRPISFIHNPVRFGSTQITKEMAREKLGIATTARIVLAVGRICVQKNYLMLLRAMESAKIFASGDVVLYIVGGIYQPDEKTRLDQFISENNLSTYIRFVDFTHEVQTYYHAADLFVLSSAWEGFGNVLVEALAAGLPIVSSNCNFGPAEILVDGEFGNLVAVDDFVAMGKFIQQLLIHNRFDPARQIARADMFSESRAGEAYYKLICQFVGKPQ